MQTLKTRWQSGCDGKVRVGAFALIVCMSCCCGGLLILGLPAATRVASPMATATPAPTATLEPTAIPQPTATPALVVVTATPELVVVTATPEPVIVTATPEPTAIPALVVVTATPDLVAVTATPEPATRSEGPCLIKGNVNSDGEKIYHTPDSRYYEATEVRPEEGDRWFCTVQEAEAAGFRAPRN